MKYLILLFASCLFVCCKPKTSHSPSTAQELLSKTISHHAASSYQDKQLTFTIGDATYTSSFKEQKALYTMTRTFNNVRNHVIYDGGYLKYYKNDSLQSDDSFPYQIIERSLYGLLYSQSIPHNLTSNDITLSVLEDVTIRSKPYYTLQATSKDYQENKNNIIILYISKENYRIEYLALDYNALALTPQFRRLTNPRRINDVLFQDTTIFVSQDSILPLQEFYTHFNVPRLKHTKNIVLENINVTDLH